MSDDDDPLEGADVGDSVTLTETNDIWIGDLAHADTLGTDRLSEETVTELEVVEDEHGDEHVRITVESDVTKRLPRRWDADPRANDDAGVPASPSRLWVPAALTVVTVGGAAVAATWLTSRLFSEPATIDVEPVGFAELLPAVVLMLFLASLIGMALKGGLDLAVGGRR